MKTNSFVKQAAILAAASLFVRFIGFLYRLPLTGLIGDEGNAYYAAGYNFYTFAIILSSGALPVAISKLVAERIAAGQYRNAHELVKTAMRIALILGAAGGLFLFFCAGWLAEVSHYPEAVHSIRTLAPTIFIVAIMAVFRGYFQGMQSAIPTAVSQVAEGIFNAVFSVWLAYLFYDAAHIEYAAAGGTAGTGIGAAAGLIAVGGLYFLVAPRLRERVRTDFNKKFYEPFSRHISVILKTALPIILGMSIFAIANMIDMVMIKDRLLAGNFFTEEEINVLYGQFSGKYIVLTTLPVALSYAMAQAVAPNLAASNTMREIRNKSNMALRISMIISIPAAVGLGVLANPILMLLFRGYPSGGFLLQYGVISIIFLALTQTVTGILNGLGRVMVPAIGAFFGVLVKLPLNYFLIATPSVNILGAVVSTCFCYMIAAGINIYFLQKYIKLKLDVAGSFIKPGLASLVMGLACYCAYHIAFLLTGINALATLGALLTGFIIYLLFMGFIRGFKKADLEAMPIPEGIKRLLWH